MANSHTQGVAFQEDVIPLKTCVPGIGVVVVAVVDPGAAVANTDGRNPAGLFRSPPCAQANRVGLTNALDKVCSLNGFTFNFNETGSELGFPTDITYVGVSAQEVQKVLPEAVRPAPVDDKYITVQYEKIVPLLIEAIKEPSDKVSALEDKLNN